MATPIDRDKLLSIGILGQRTRDRVDQVRDESGRPVGKAVTDQLGNTVTTFDERQDVTIRPEAVAVRVGVS
jgi:hypothetical protein